MRITTFVVKAVAMDAKGGRLYGQPCYLSISDSLERTVRKARYLLRVMSELPMSDVFGMGTTQDCVERIHSE